MRAGLFEIDIVESEEFEKSDYGICINYPTFLLNSLKKYNNKQTIIDIDWNIVILDDFGKIIYDFNIYENEEFKELLKKKL